MNGWLVSTRRLLLVALLLSPNTVFAQTGIVTDDAFTSASPELQSANDRGNGPAMVVAGNASGQAIGYIRFTLTPLPSGTTQDQVAKATLKLFVSDVRAVSALMVSRVTGAWDESSLAAGTVLTLTPETSRIPVTRAQQFVTVDVTQLVRDWISGQQPNDGLALVAATESSFMSFDSKESPLTGHEPALEITLVAAGSEGPTGPAGPPGPAGPIGPQGPAGEPGAATVFDATQFDIGGNRVLSNGGTGNIFVGVNAGTNNTNGMFNAFVGVNAGTANTDGSRNSFFGRGAGFNNITGSENAFFGAGAGFTSTTGSGNVFLGDKAGNDNTTGSNNVFIGLNSGNPNVATQVTNSVAIGANAVVSQNNTIVLGTSTHRTRVPGQLQVDGAGVVTFGAPGGLSGLLANHVLLRRFATNEVLPSPAPVCFRFVNGTGSDGGAGLTTCTTSSSSIRFKKDLEPFSRGLDLVHLLKPTMYTLKASNERDIGLIAEEVAEVEPLFTYNEREGRNRRHQVREPERRLHQRHQRAAGATRGTAEGVAGAAGPSAAAAGTDRRADRARHEDAPVTTRHEGDCRRS